MKGKITSDGSEVIEPDLDFDLEFDENREFSPSDELCELIAICKAEEELYGEHEEDEDD